MTAKNNFQFPQLIAIIALIGNLIGCGADCINTVVTEVVSPNGSLVATVYKRDCGATTLENTQVAIRRKGEAFKANNSASVFIIETEKNVSVVWETDFAMQISFSGDGDIFRQQKTDGNVTISYRKQP